MVRAAGSEMCEFGGISGIYKSKNLGGGAERTNQALLGRHAAPHKRVYILGEREMILKNGCMVPAKQLCSPSFEVLGYELPELVDDRDGVRVALMLGVSPRKKTVAAQNDTVAVGRLLYGVAQHHGQLKTR